jgi:hypothetical protein
MGIAMTIKRRSGPGPLLARLRPRCLGDLDGNRVGFLTPRIKTLNALIEERGEKDPAVQAAVRPILLAARLDIALLLLIVIDMTVKPSF